MEGLASTSTYFLTKNLKTLLLEGKLPIRKLIIRQFKKWGADLAELQLISMCSKGIKFLVCGIDM